MKRTNAQFAVVFVGVLLLHLAVATALMKSAQTDEPSLSAATVDPTYHSPPPKNEPPTRGPTGDRERQVPDTQPEKNSGAAKTIPDAFAESAKNSPGSSNAVPPPAIPETAPPNDKPKTAPKDPSPEPTIRRLTVNQLLAGDPPDPKSKPAAETKTPAPTSGAPKVKPLPATESKTGPRKIRSLSGAGN